jgi:hypothetical protein
VLKISLSVGILNIDSGWLIWLLVLMGAVLLAVALLRRKIWDKGGSIEQPNEPNQKSQEPGDEINQEKFIENNKEGPVEILRPAQSGSAKSGTSGVKYWLHQVVDFIRRSSKIQSALELLLISLVVFFFCQSFLNLESVKELPGNESQVFQALDWVFYHSVTQNHQFPIWDPWMHTGQPNVADPMFHSLNPLVGISTLVWGVLNGFKVALFLSILTAALGMRQLGAALGLSRVVRTWMALVFAFAGQPLAHALQGQYLFIFGFAWIPWSIWGLYKLWRTRHLVYIALSALAIALLILSGNSYYAFYLAFALAIFAIVTVITLQRKSPFVRVDWKMLGSYTAVGMLSLCLVAIHLLPLLQFSSSMSKGIGIYGSQTPWQILLDFTSKDTFRPDAYSALPAREEYYAYIGWVPLALALLAPFAFRRGKRRIILFACILLAFVVLWIDLLQMPWRSFYESSQFLLLFRHLLRPLVFGSFVIVLLAGIGLSNFWQWVKAATQEALSKSTAIKLAAKWTLGILVMVMGISVFDLYATHQSFFQTEEACQSESKIMTLLVEYDPGEYYTQFFPNNACLKSLLAAGARFLEPWYHWADYRQVTGSLETRVVQAMQRYTILPLNDPTPQATVLTQVHTEAYQVYYHPDSLPMAFSVSNDILEQPAGGPLGVTEVNAQLPYFDGPNKVEITAEGQINERLVLLVTHDPGWNLYVDGKPAPVLKISGYLAADMLAGTHQYKFVYLPRSYQIGLLLSLVGLLVSISLIAYDIRFALTTWLQRSRAFLTRVRSYNLQDLLNRMKGLPKGRRHNPDMIIQSEAVYHHSKIPGEGTNQPYFSITNPLNLQDGQPVNLTVEMPPWTADRQTFTGQMRTAWRRWRWVTVDLVGIIWRSIPLETALFTIAVVLYLSTRLIGLSYFPIYFFTDEAVQTVMAEDFIQHGLRNNDGEFLPTYFSRDPTYNLSSVSVYAQVIPYLLFGKSVFVTRAVSVLISILAALAIGLILRDIFKLRYWWLGVLLLSIAPAWFLHSRTAFETVEMTAFYAGFLYFYLRYRYISPKALYGALVMGALVFYTYSPGQLIIVVTGILLLFSDIRYHWQNRKIALRGLMLLAILVLPYLRYVIAHPQALTQQLSTRAPYWSQNIPLIDKLRHYFSDYAYGLNPSYWFIPNQHDLERHLMKGYGNLLITTLPLFILGLLVTLSKLRSSAHRAILISLLASPSGSALVGIGITRILVFVIPAVTMMAFGLNLLLGWLEKGLKWLFHRWRAIENGRQLFFAISIIMMLILGAVNIGMLRDSLVNGPLWYQDYTLAGMQYGASQLFTAVNEYVNAHPDAELVVSPSWTNGADVVAQFFLPPGAPVRMGSIEGHLFQHLPLNDQMVFVMIPTEMDKVVSSGKFKAVRVDEVLPYPNGAPGFYFTHLQYVDNIDEILADEQKLRSALQETTLTIQGETVEVGYSMLDMGSIDLVFDGDAQTVARTLEANPFIIELTFQNAHQISGYKMILGSADASVTAWLYPKEGNQPMKFIADFNGSVRNPTLEVNFDQTVTTQKIRFEIFQPHSGVPANVHVWEIVLR